jgi:hypothetical protein
MLPATPPCRRLQQSNGSRDISKLHGAAEWANCHLFVILDIFGHQVVGWMVARESAGLADKLMAACLAHHERPIPQPACVARHPGRYC